MTKKKIIVQEKEDNKKRTTVDVLFKVVDGDPPAHIADTKILRTHISSLKQRIDATHMELAGCLEYAFEVQAFRDWGFPTWRDYIEGELEISIRKAEYLQRNWRWFAKIIKDPSVRQKIEEIGWTKASLLVGVVDESNVDHWVKTAKQNNRDKLKQIVNNAKAGSKEKDGGNIKLGKPEVFTNMTFRLTPEQKENIESALDLAGQIAESDKPGHLLDMICTSFVADNRFQIAPGQKMLQHYLYKIEAILGTKFIVVDPKTSEVVIGRSVLEKFIKEGL